ncbi:zona pellucida sperm-binding protein 3d.2 [Pempheris klunzingeri]|uniref:zona pellucida sperm-binding protein 3d.2 n=1 Tax=Pempheris klunzingeri TaxID=3127111 RepID=UPI00397EE24B
MVYLSLVFVLPLLSSTGGGSVPSFEAFQPTAQVMTKVSRRQTTTLPPPFLHLPMFVDSRLPLVDKERLSPARGTGQEPIPESVRGVLLPVRPAAGPLRASGVSVRTSCRRNKMLVEVQRSILGAGEPQPRLQLGACRASKSTRDYIYFEYDIGMCGTKSTISNNQVVYSNILHYDPPRVQGPIRRAVPFALPVTCYYNRYQYSYKIGYIPKMRMRKVFKPLNRAKVILTPRNAQWERLSPSDHYVLGKPMYFQAEAPSMSRDKRLYLHSCYVTPETSHASTPQFPVVKNFGCMVESKHKHSRFLPYKNNAVRFSVDAFLFRGITGRQLNMHCTMSVGSSVPTPTTKSCNYDAKARRWVELYGEDSVCTCCDSNCSSFSGTRSSKVISTRSWRIQPEVKPTTTPKRKTLSTTTAATHKPVMTREVTDWWTTSQPEAIRASLMGQVKESKWLSGGGGVKWVDVEERQVKGSAVVEEEEEEVTGPHTIFEEIFAFDK